MPRNADCQLCPLHESANTVCVWGSWRGDPEWRGPLVMVVGQSPGKQEDYTGVPFYEQAPSGAMIAEAMREAGIGRYYVTNAAKCSPEVNGVEIDMAYVRACADYLDDEIYSIKPAFILALGNPAVQRLLGRGKVSEVAGKEVWASRYQAWVMSAWHPAAILRNQGRKPAWLADILRFGRLVRGELAPPPNKPDVRVEMVSTGAQLEGLSRLLLTEPAWSYDFETNVPDKNRSPGWCHKDFRAYSVAFSFSGVEASSVVLDHPDVTDPRWREYVLRWFKNLWRTLPTVRQLTRIAWNDVFDGLVAYRLSGVLVPIQFDAMLSAHLLDENAPKSLKWNGRARLGWPDWDIDSKVYHPIKLLCEYNGYDAAGTYQLWDQDRFRLREEGLDTYFHEMDMAKLWFTQNVVKAGIHIDRSQVAKNMLAAWRRRQEADDRIYMESLGIVKNPRSDTQVARWLYDELKLHEKMPGIKMGKKHYTTNEETINLLARISPEVRQLLDCRRPNKEISTYYRRYAHMTRVAFDHRYHADMRLTSVETGRKGSGFHTTPRPEESIAVGLPPVRPVFGASPGNVLVVADYRQLEARLAAWSAAGKPETWEQVQPGTMLYDFLCGVDVYKKFASQPLVLNKHPDKITKDERQRMGKVPVLALLYTISPKGLREYAWRYYEIDWTLAQATKIYSAFHQLYPEFPYWHRMEEAKLRRRGYVVSAIGRVRRLPGAQAGVPDDIRAGINAPVQSVASDITQTAGGLLIRAIQTHKLPYLTVGDVHDSILAEGPEARRDHLCEVVRTAMLLAPRILERMGLRVPASLIDVEITVGPWGAGVEWKPS